jgi:hypothetical protein
MPKFEPDKWNKDFKLANNCYNYVANQVSERVQKALDDNLIPIDKNDKPVLSIPGMAGGKPPAKPPWTCKNVKEGAEADGFKSEIGGKPVTKDSKCPEGCWKVALVIAPDDPKDPKKNDFHFYRQDDDGNWSHKRGLNGDATNKDFSGKVITDPEKADRGKYTEFCGYFCACPKELKQVAAFPPDEKKDESDESTETNVFATVTLKEPTILVTSSMELELPVGRFSINYEEEELMPTGEPSVTVCALINSGRENPCWELSTNELEVLRSKLIDLPLRKTEPSTNSTYQGFHINNPDNAIEIPSRVHVFNGTVDVWEGESSIQYEDAHQLEQWLSMLAASTSFGSSVRSALEEISG